MRRDRIGALFAIPPLGYVQTFHCPVLVAALQGLYVGCDLVGRFEAVLHGLLGSKDDQFEDTRRSNHFSLPQRFMKRGFYHLARGAIGVMRYYATKRLSIRAEISTIWFCPWPVRSRSASAKSS